MLLHGWGFVYCTHERGHAMRITAIKTDATETLNTHLRDLPKGTIAIFAPLYDPPITITKMVDGTWLGWAGHREITVTTNAIQSSHGSLTIIYKPER